MSPNERVRTKFGLADLVRRNEWFDLGAQMGGLEGERYLPPIQTA